MIDSIKAIFYHGPEDVRVEQVPVGLYAEDEMLWT